MGIFTIGTELTSEGLKNLIRDGKAEIIFSEGNENELINEFNIYAKDKQGKVKTKIMVRNHIDDARDSKEMQHGASIKVYDRVRDVYVPVLTKLDDNGKIQMPDDVKKKPDNVRFINSKNKILTRLIKDESENLQRYWDADSRTPEGRKEMDRIKTEMENKYPFKKN